MKIIFFGTGKFALPALKKLIESRHDIAAVVTQPDTRKGRGWNVHPTPVKAFIEQVSPGTPLLQPEKASEISLMDSLRAINADIFAVVDYGQLLAKALIEMPGKYSVNLHPSLLPKYRGASPANYAILNGDKETGITVIKMAERMDAGSIILQRKVKIKEEENAAELLEKLSQSGADLLLETLDLIDAGKEKFIEQDEKAASYAPKLKKKDGEIDWTREAEEIARKVRGMRPWPCAFTSLDGKRLKIIEAEAAEVKETDASPGTVCDPERFIVNTGKGILRINVLQLEGRKVMPSSEFIRGYKLKQGTILK